MRLHASTRESNPARPAHLELTASSMIADRPDAKLIRSEALGTEVAIEPDVARFPRQACGALPLVRRLRFTLSSTTLAR
jgi:hypothetical protein